MERRDPIALDCTQYIVSDTSNVRGYPNQARCDAFEQGVDVDFDVVEDGLHQSGSAVLVWDLLDMLLGNHTLSEAAYGESSGQGPQYSILRWSLLQELQKEEESRSR